jgi:hypothetical protein
MQVVLTIGSVSNDFGSILKSAQYDINPQTF